MTYTNQALIKGNGVGDPEKVKAWLRSQGVGRPDDADDYVDAIYELAPILGINPDVAIAQFIHESSDRATGSIPGQGVPWLHGLNPTGIGVESDALWRVYQFANGRNAAIAHLMQLSIYVNGTDLPDDWEYSIEYPYSFAPNPAPRWYKTVAAGRAGTATVIDDLSGTWAADKSYGTKIATKLNQLLDATQESPMATHRYVLSAGHRNTNGGGARNEINWTYPSVVALKAAIEARGGKAIIVHQRDGDSDPSFSVGRGLQNVAGLCVALAEANGPFDAYISSHYNGGSSPGFHAIFPDAWSGVDTKANNPLDVRLARAMRDEVKATGTVKMLSWTADSPGVMSERETGVGAQGYRLGEFVGTLGFRDTTARVIIEASSIDVASEAKFINDPFWVRNVYSEAIVDALESVFGKFQSTPTPEPPPSNFVSKKPISALLDLPAYHEVFDAAGKRIAQLVRADYTVKVNKATPALEYAGAGAKVQADFNVDDLVDVEYLIINDDGHMYWYTADGIRFAFNDADPYFPDVDE